MKDTLAPRLAHFVPRVSSVGRLWADLWDNVSCAENVSPKTVSGLERPGRRRGRGSAMRIGSVTSIGLQPGGGRVLMPVTMMNDKDDGVFQSGCAMKSLVMEGDNGSLVGGSQ